MPDEEINDLEQGEPEQPQKGSPQRPPRRYVTRRNAAFAFGLVAVLGILLALLTIVSYRTGVIDSYIKTQFVTKMADIGMVFEAEVSQADRAAMFRTGQD